MSRMEGCDRLQSRVVQQCRLIIASLHAEPYKLASSSRGFLAVLEAAVYHGRDGDLGRRKRCCRTGTRRLQLAARDTHGATQLAIVYMGGIRRQRSMQLRSVHAR